MSERTQGTAPEPGGGAAAVGLTDLFAMLRRHVPAVVAIVGLTGLLGYLVTAAMIPKYDAQALLMVRGERIESLQVEIDQLRMEPGFPTVLSEAEILSSPGLLDRVVERLELTGNPEFNPRLTDDYELPPVRAALTGLRDAVGLAPAPKPRNPTLERRIVLARLEGAVAVQPRGRSYVVEVKATSRSPGMAAELANGVADVYVATARQERSRRLEELDTWLDQRLAELRTEVIQRANAVETFRQREGLFEGQTGNLMVEELSGQADTLVEAQADTARAAAQLDEVRRAAAKGAATNALSMVVDAPLIQRLRSEEVELSGALARVASTSGPRHPQVVALKQELAELRARLGQEIDKVVALAEQRLENARAREAAIAASRDELQQKIDDKRAAFIRLAELERDLVSAEDALASFQTQANQLVGAGEIEQPTARVVSSAQPPLSPSSPPVKAILVLSLVAGTLLAGLYVLLRETMGERVRNAQDLAGLAGLADLRLLTAIPRVRGLSLAELAAGHRNEDKHRRAFAQSMRRLYAALRHPEGADKIRCVLLCSSEPGEGKSVTALGLARQAAAIGRRTLLIDLDLHRRETGRAFGTASLNAEAQPDLADAMETPERLGELEPSEPAGRLHVLASRTEMEDPLSCLEHPRLDVLLREARRRFDLVILDSPALLSVPDATLVVRRVDACLLLIRWNRTRRSAVRQALELLASVQAPLFGCAFSQVEPRRFRRYQEGEAALYPQPVPLQLRLSRQRLSAPS